MARKPASDHPPLPADYTFPAIPGTIADRSSARLQALEIAAHPTAERRSEGHSVAWIACSIGSPSSRPSWRSSKPSLPELYASGDRNAAATPAGDTPS